MNAKSMVLLGAALALIPVIAYSAYRLWDIQKNYAMEAEMRAQLLPYRPVLPRDNPAQAAQPLSPGETPLPAPRANQSVVDLQALYPDAVGWLGIPGTAIDYPFAQSGDNDHYLHHDLDGKQSAAGSLFIDYRNPGDFSGFNTIIFGHNMKNGAMFGTLQKFNDEAFFNANKTGVIFLAGATFEVEIFAYAVVRPNDPVIYSAAYANEAEKQVFLDYVSAAARHYRNIGETASDHFVTLSTCSYEFNNGRMVLIGRLTALTY